jgi:hypothetical protein
MNEASSADFEIQLASSEGPIHAAGMRYIDRG